MIWIEKAKNHGSRLKQYDGQGWSLIWSGLQKLALWIGSGIKRVLPEAVAILFFAAVAALVTWPTAQTATTQLIGDGGDNYGFAISQYIVGQKITAGEYPFGHTTLFRYPYGFNFGVGADAALLTVIGSLLQPVLGVVLAYNTTVLLGFILTAFTAFVLARYLSKKTVIGLLAGVMYGFSFYSLARGAGHLNLLMTGGFPLLLYSLLKLKEGVTWQKVLVAATAVVLITAGSLQYALMTPIAVVVMGLMSLIVWPKATLSAIQTYLRKLHLFILAGLLAGSLMLFHTWPYVTNLLSGQFMWRSEERAYILEKYNLELTDVVKPNVQSHLYLNQLGSSSHGPSIEHASVFIGYIELLILAFFLLTARSTKTKVWAVGVIAILLTFTLGVSEAGVALPYQQLTNVFPFSGILESGRFIVLINLVLVVALSLGVGSIKNKWLSSILAFVLMSGLLLERLPTAYYQSPSLQSPATDVVKELPGKAVFNIPLDTNLGTNNLQPAFTNKAIVDGYFHWSAETPETLQLFEDAGLAKRFLCDAQDTVFNSIENPATLQQETQQNQALLEMLYQNDVKVIVVHKDSAYYHPHCQNVRTRVGLLAPVFKTLKPDISQQKIEQTYRNTALNLNLFAPQDGTFDLEGIFAYPAAARDLTLNVATTSAQFEFEDDRNGGLVYRGLDNNFILKPHLRFEVKAGEIISLGSSQFVDNGLLAVWFKYQSVAGSTELAAAPRLKEVYQDDSKQVFVITR